MTLPISQALVTNSVAAASVMWPGGTGMLEAVATSWAASTLTLQYLGPDGATWVATTTTLTSNGEVAFTQPQGLIRGVISGGAPTGLYANAAVETTTVD